MKKYNYPRYNLLDKVGNIIAPYCTLTDALQRIVDLIMEDCGNDEGYEGIEGITKEECYEDVLGNVQEAYGGNYTYTKGLNHNFIIKLLKD